MDWKMSLLQDVLFVDGVIDVQRCPAFCSALSANLSKKPALVDMQDLEIEDGVSMAQIISTLRSNLPLTIRHAPQMLAHTIYKIGMLDTGDFTLITPREDEGMGA